MPTHGLALRWLPLGFATALLVLATLLTSCGGQPETATPATAEPTPALAASAGHSAATPASTPTLAPISADLRAASPPPTSALAPTRKPTLTTAATVTPTPTVTALPTATPTSPPTPTVVPPTSSPPPTSTPTAPSPIAGIERAAWLERNKPDLADQIKALPWVADGIDASERDAVQMLVDSANHYPDTFSALLRNLWVTDDVLTAAETNVIYAIRWTARRDEAATLAILDMPFLETLEYDDSLAALALYRLARYADDGRFKTVMEHPTLEGGVTDDLTTLVAAVGTIREADEVERMLDPGYARIEVFTGRTELSPELKISIVRTHSGRRPETMPELVRIAEQLENLMQVPLPKPHMIFVVNDYATSVSSRGISQGRRYDFAYGLRGDREDTQRFASEYATDRPMLPSVMIHEIGHDYFGNEIKSWLNHTPVKTFEYVYRLDGRDRAEAPEKVLNIIQRRGCEARNIQHLEEMNPPSSDRTNRLCHHYLGYWMGRELLEAVGQEEYFARMRRLYHRKEALVAEGADPGIAEIRELFPDQLEIVEHYWSGDVGNPEEKYWGGLANLIGHPLEHTFGCCCAGCAPADA